MLIATNLNIDVTPPPSDKKAELNPRFDPTIARATAEQLREISFVGQRIFNRLCCKLDFIYVDGPFTFGVQNGFILMERIVRQTDAQGNLRTKCAAQVLSNRYSGPLTISIGHPGSKVPSTHHKDFSCYQLTDERLYIKADASKNY